MENGNPAIVHPHWCDRSHCARGAADVRHVSPPLSFKAGEDDANVSARLFRRDELVGTQWHVQKPAVWLSVEHFGFDQTADVHLELVDAEQLADTLASLVTVLRVPWGERA